MNEIKTELYETNWVFGLDFYEVTVDSILKLINYHLIEIHS